MGGFLGGWVCYSFAFCVWEACGSFCIRTERFNGRRNIKPYECSPVLELS